MTVEELLGKLIRLETLDILKDPASFFHLLRRVSAVQCEFRTSTLYKNLAQDEEYTKEMVILPGKVKFILKMSHNIEQQRAMTFNCWRDGARLMTDDYFMDIEMVPPFSLEAWYVVKKNLVTRYVNTYAGTNWLKRVVFLVLLEREVWDKIEKNLLVPYVKEVLG